MKLLPGRPFPGISACRLLAPAAIVTSILLSLAACAPAAIQEQAAEPPPAVVATTETAGTEQAAPVPMTTVITPSVPDKAAAAATPPLAELTAANPANPQPTAAATPAVANPTVEPTSQPSAAFPSSTPTSMTDAPPLAAELAGISAWINSDPLTLQQLRGQVVLIDFWTYTCVNCIRTFPYLKLWHSRYADDGLVILGIHTPEFEFEKDYDNVRPGHGGQRNPLAGGPG